MITRIPNQTNILRILENQNDIDEIIMQDTLKDLVKASVYFDVPSTSKDVLETLRNTYFFTNINEELNDLLNSGDFELLKNIVLQSLNLSRFGERTQDGVEISKLRDR